MKDVNPPKLMKAENRPLFIIPKGNLEFLRVCDKTYSMSHLGKTDLYISSWGYHAPDAGDPSHDECGDQWIHGYGMNPAWVPDVRNTTNDI